MTTLGRPSCLLDLVPQTTHVSARSRRAQGVPSFAEAAARVLEQKRADWRSGSHAQAWMSSLERYAFPRIVKYIIPKPLSLLDGPVSRTTTSLKMRRSPNSEPNFANVVSLQLRRQNR